MPKRKADRPSDDSEYSSETEDDDSSPDEKKLKSETSETETPVEPTETESESDAHDNGPTEFALGTSGYQVHTCVFNGEPRVDIRFYFPRNGEMVPTQKGVSLKSSEWNDLTQLVPEITAALAHVKQDKE